MNSAQLGSLRFASIANVPKKHSAGSRASCPRVGSRGQFCEPAPFGNELRVLGEGQAPLPPASSAYIPGRAPPRLPSAAGALAPAAGTRRAFARLDRGRTRPAAARAKQASKQAHGVLHPLQWKTPGLTKRFVCFEPGGLQRNAKTRVSGGGTKRAIPISTLSRWLAKDAHLEGGRHDR